MSLSSRTTRPPSPESTARLFLDLTSQLTLLTILSHGSPYWGWDRTGVGWGGLGSHRLQSAQPLLQLTGGGCTENGRLEPRIGRRFQLEREAGMAAEAKEALGGGGGPVGWCVRNT